MSTQHTPGPWKQGTHEVGSPFMIYRERDMMAVCEMKNRHNENCEANARLIAAAPELLEQLKAAQEMVFRYALSEAHKWTGDVSGSKAIEHAEKTVEPFRAAIAKATGKPVMP